MQLKPKPTLLTAAILCSIAFFLGKCAGPEPDFQPDKQATIDSLNRANTILEHEKLCLKSNLDSIATQITHHDSIRTIYRTRYQIIREIVPTDSAQCFELLAETRADCDSALVSADSVIIDLRAKDSLHIELEAVQQGQIALRDSIITILQKDKSSDVEKERKRGNRKALRSGVIGAVAGFIGGLFVN